MFGKCDSLKHGKPAQNSSQAASLFLWAFLASCILFWWLPTMLYRVLGMEGPIKPLTLWMSMIGMLAFVVGYLLPPTGFRIRPLAPAVLNACERLAYLGTLVIAVPALSVATHFAYSRIGVPYGTGDPIPRFYQFILYAHLYVGLLFLGVARGEFGNRRRLACLALLITLPRLIVSLQGGRFFLAQAVLPIVFLSVARGWVVMSFKRILLFGSIALFLIFVPAFTRGDNLLGANELTAFLYNGGTLRLFQDNVDLDVSTRCPPLLVSLTAKTIPYSALDGEKISFMPTPNLELSFSRTAEFGGLGRAVTLGALLRSYFSLQSSAAYSASQNPGERNGGFDFSYRVPGLRDWLTVYADLMSRDDPNPLDAPRRASWNPGLYLAWIPYVPHLDLRMEAVNTDPPSAPARNGQFDYWEGFYDDLYTNKNNLVGDWIGREGLGFQAWSTYWFSPKNTLVFGYRHSKVDARFVPYGETLNDGSVSLSRWIQKDLQVNASLQYEKWNAPLLAPKPQTNWTSSLAIVFWAKSMKL
jgi:Capsule assembly protein Wzi